MTQKPKSEPQPERKSFEPEAAAGAATLAEKVVKKAPNHQVDDSEKARLAKEASRQSDA